MINDEKEFNITVHYVDEGIDTGDIILQRSYQILDKDNYKTLLEEHTKVVTDTLYDAIIMFKECYVKKPKNRLKFILQDFIVRKERLR